MKLAVLLSHTVCWWNISPPEVALYLCCWSTYVPNRIFRVCNFGSEIGFIRVGCNCDKETRMSDGKSLLWPRASRINPDRNLRFTKVPRLSQSYPTFIVCISNFAKHKLAPNLYNLFCSMLSKSFYQTEVSSVATKFVIILLYS